MFNQFMIRKSHLFVTCVKNNLPQNWVWKDTLCSTIKLKRFKKIAWIRSHHLHLQWKFKLWAGKFAWSVKAKHCWGDKAKCCWVMSINFLFSKRCWQCPATFCLYTSSKLSCPWFEFSLKMKVMESNPGYLLTSFLL